MTIGTALFNTQSIRAFGQLDRQIADLQGQISSGKADPTPSADPARAAAVSAATARQAALTRHAGNLTTASTRLSAADTALGQAGSLMDRLQQIAQSAASATTGLADRAALRAEAAQIRDSLQALANTTDATGQPVFGDEATLRISDTGNLATGLSGDEIFQAVPTAQGPRSVFALVDDLVAGLGAASAAFASATGAAQLDLRAGGAGQVSLSVTGPLGSASVSADLAAGNPGALMDALNAQSDKTGLTARLAADGKGLVLAATGGGAITVSALQDSRGAAGATLQPLDASGNPTGTAMALSDIRRDAASLLPGLQAAGTQLIAARGTVGALSAVAAAGTAAIAERQTRLSETLASLTDLDLPAAITRLQSLMLTRDAAQQTYVKISQQSLFDYLR